MKHRPSESQVKQLALTGLINDIHTFFDSSDKNIVFRSVPMIILSFANSNCEAFNLSAPSTAALMAAMFTKFARSEWEAIEMRIIDECVLTCPANFCRDAFTGWTSALENLNEWNDIWIEWKRKLTSPIEPWGATSNCFDIYIIRQWFILQIELQYLLTAPHIWIWNNNLEANFC